MEDKTLTGGLESLLQEQQDAVDHRIKEDASKFEFMPNNKPLKADKSATLFDFIQMVGKVVSRAMKEDGVEFLLDEGKRIPQDPKMQMDHPYITYKVKSRTPKNEIKPRERESFIKEDTFSQTDARQGRIYGQKFVCEVQFNIIASEYTQADRVMNIFEDLIFSYTHYFKKNGVSELFFQKHLTDTDYDIYRQDISVRNLVYYVEVEKLYVMFDSEIDGVFVK